MASYVIRKDDIVKFRKRLWLVPHSPRYGWISLDPVFKTPAGHYQLDGHREHFKVMVVKKKAVCKDSLKSPRHLTRKDPE